MHAAIYARVSTERQERDQTIDSQLAALQTWVQQQGYDLLPEHCFTDEDYSGARLDRPGLDRLRDAAREGVFSVVAILSPDRLARKYAYQVLLLEEFRRLGCPVVFLQHPISDDPHDQLLLQIQGAIAEYERAVLAERFRRGRLQRARAGHYQSGKAPYGYRYLPNQESCPGHLVVDETEAAVVRTLFGWVIEEHLTLRQVLKRLKDSPWRPRSGTPHWSISTVRNPHRPSLRRYRLCQPLRPPPAPQAPPAGQPWQFGKHLSPPQAAGGVDCYSGPGAPRPGHLRLSAGPTRPQSGAVLPPRRPASLLAAVPAHVWHLWAGDARHHLPRHRDPPGAPLLPLCREGSDHARAAGPVPAPSGQGRGVGNRGLAPSHRPAQ